MQPVKQPRRYVGGLWQNAEKILIVLFFATFAFNVRKVFLTPFSYLAGGFNEYMTFSLGWADILMVGAVVIYTIKEIFSQIGDAAAADSSLYNVIRKMSNVIRNYYGENVSRETFWLLLFLAWAGLSVFWAQYKPIAVYKFLTLVEIALFVLISIKTLKSQKWFRASLLALLFNSSIQALLGIVQFAKNGSVGLHVLGESIVGPNIDGVAKVIIEGEKHIRAYGMFPHPNILAGFLIFPLLLLLVEGKNRSNNVSRETLLGFIPDWLFYVCVVLVATGFALTLSRSAFLGIFVGLAVFILPPIKGGSRTFILPISFLVSIALVTVFLFQFTSFFSTQSIQERSLYQSVSYETISAHPVKGIGIGQFVLYEYLKHPKLESWQYQPVHNSYLLIFSELGTVGFVLLLLFLVFVSLKFLRDETVIIPYYLTYTILYCIIISFLTISFFDHYFWDIKIGTLIFVLPIIFLGKSKK